MNSQNMAFPLAFTRLNAIFYLVPITQVIINKSDMAMPGKSLFFSLF